MANILRDLIALFVHICSQNTSLLLLCILVASDLSFGFGFELEFKFFNQLE
jgi:hypothetical protein